MHLGNITLYTGMAIFLIGFILSLLWTISFQYAIEKNTNIKEINLDPFKSVDIPLFVPNNSLYIVINPIMFDGYINATIIDPNERTISQKLVSKTFLMYIDPNDFNTYNLRLSNLDEDVVKVNLLYGTNPNITNYEIENANFKLITIGSAVMILGIVCILASLIIIIIDIRKK